MNGNQKNKFDVKRGKSCIVGFNKKVYTEHFPLQYWENILTYSHGTESIEYIYSTNHSDWSNLVPRVCVPLGQRRLIGTSLEENHFLIRAFNSREIKFAYLNVHVYNTCSTTRARRVGCAKLLFRPINHWLKTHILQTVPWVPAAILPSLRRLLFGQEIFHRRKQFGKLS